MIWSARCSSKQTTPGKSCLSDGPSEKKSVCFGSSAPESTSLATDLQPARWIDSFLEPNGTHPSLFASGENEKHEDRVHGAIHEADGTWSTSAVDGSQSARAQATEFFFHTGENTGGAELQAKHVKALITRDGRTSCVDDVSGEVLDEAGVRAVRA